MTAVTVSRAVVGAGVAICFTPCHHQHIRLEDRAQSSRAEVVTCRACGCGYAVTFPPMPP